MTSAFVDWVMGGIEQLRLLLQGVPGLYTVTATPSLFRPFVMLIVLGIAAGLVGVIVNLRSLEFNAEAMVHSVFPGIVGGALYGGIENIVPGAAIVAILAAIALTWINRSTRINEAGTAVVLTSFFGLGVVMSLRKGDMSGQLEALMFGRLLEVSDTRMVQSLLVCVIAMLVVAVSWRAQIFRAFDRDGAQASGMNGAAIDFLANAAIAAVVVASASAVGVLLVIGYLVVPGAAARLVGRKISTMVVIAIVVGVAGGYLGMQFMMANLSRPVSPQAAVTLALVAIYLLLIPVATLFEKRGWVRG
ncbi:MAG: metal ABC transporter permease [Lawsonella sp.]